MADATSDAIIVIPARYASSRYPAKPLALLRGATGIEKPLIQRSHEAACAVATANHVVVATDDVRIAEAVETFGGAVVMTPTSCANGTERVAAALPHLPAHADIIVNFQGDALLTPPHLVEALISHMSAHPECLCATIAVRCSPTAYRHLVTDQAQGRVGGTTAVCNAAGDALYFSKRVIPYLTEDRVDEMAGEVLMHLGLYAYRRQALEIYAAAAPSMLEQVEGLEQLRFLHHGVPMHVVRADAPDWDVIELNNPSDVEPIEAILARRGIL